MKLSCTSFFRASSSSSGKQSSRFRSATRARDFSLLHRKWPSRSPSFCLDDMGKKDKRYSRNTIAHDGHKRGCQRGVFLYLDDLAILPDRKSTRLNSSHVRISYAVFCLKKKKTI